MKRVSLGLVICCRSLDCAAVPRVTYWVVKASLGCPGQDTVGFAQPSPQLADGFVRLFLSCAKDPVDPGFEVGRSAF